MEVSPTLGALLNAIFGNAVCLNSGATLRSTTNAQGQVGVIVEVIVGIVALFQGVVLYPVKFMLSIASRRRASHCPNINAGLYSVEYLACARV